MAVAWRVFLDWLVANHDLSFFSLHFGVDGLVSNQSSNVALVSFYSQLVRHRTNLVERLRVIVVSQTENLHPSILSCDFSFERDRLIAERKGAFAIFREGDGQVVFGELTLLELREDVFGKLYRGDEIRLLGIDSLYLKDFFVSHVVSFVVVVVAVVAFAFPSVILLLFIV